MYEFSQNDKKSDKFQWKDELLDILNLTNEKYSLKEIENHLNSNFKKGHFLNFDNNQWEKLQVPGWKKRIRTSYFMNHILNKFIIKNDRPSTKYYSHDFDFNKLNKNELNNIIKIINSI